MRISGELSPRDFGEALCGAITASLGADAAEVLTAWPQLSAGIRAAIVAAVRDAVPAEGPQSLG